MTIKPYTLLLVDDTPVNLMVAVESLELDGYEVLVAVDGEEALKRAEKTLPDLILLDVMMPGMDGFEVCRRLKGQVITRDIPVIFMTSLNGVRDKVEGFSTGAVDYVTKPLQIEEIRARVGVHIKLRDLQRQLEKQNLKLQSEIDEREQMENYLSESRMVLAEAQRIAQIGSWDLDLVTNRLYWSDEIFRIFEIDPDKFTASYEGFINAIHPDDREMVNRAYTESLASSQPYIIEHRLLMADGRIKYVHERCETHYASDGKPFRSLGTVQDITERKHMEKKLRMAASVFDTALEGILITDNLGTILDVNPAFTHISGYTREEAIGAKPGILSSGEHGRKFYTSMWNKLVKHGCWSGEIVNCHKDGSLFTEHLNITSVVGERGEVARYVGVFTDISHAKQQEKQMEHIAHHDSLTGLPNRVLLSDRMQQAISYAGRGGEMFAILFIDLDGFKPINDRFGHDVGDMVLSEIAQRLSKVLRTSDTVARIGGDEFVVLLLLGQSSKRECKNAAHRILAAVEKPIRLDESQIMLSASIGISVYPDDGDDPDMLLRYADQAMYVAKRTGRNQIIFSSHSIGEKAKQYSKIADELRSALMDKHVSVHYQPIVEVATGRIVKAEALARWFHPVLGAVSPSEFIAVAEDAGLIQELGDQVFREVIQFVQEWNLASCLDNESHHRVSVNCSPRQFYSRGGLSAWIEHLQKQGVPGECLDIEITEGLLLDDSSKVVEQLNQLRSQGITISLDDFGTGFSALSYLKKFDIDYLKIDRSFVQELEGNPDDMAIVEAIIYMAHRLNIMVIAEGVETAAQLALLAAANCDLAQGYYFARPMPKNEFLSYVDSVESSVPMAEGESKQELQNRIAPSAPLSASETKHSKEAGK